MLWRAKLIVLPVPTECRQCREKETKKEQKVVKEEKKNMLKAINGIDTTAHCGGKYERAVGRCNSETGQNVCK